MVNIWYYLKTCWEFRHIHYSTKIQFRNVVDFCEGEIISHFSNTLITDKSHSKFPYLLDSGYMYLNRLVSSISLLVFMVLLLVSSLRVVWVTNNCLLMLRLIMFSIYPGAQAIMDMFSDSLKWSSTSFTISLLFTIIMAALKTDTHSTIITNNYYLS